MKTLMSANQSILKGKTVNVTVKYITCLLLCAVTFSDTCAQNNYQQADPPRKKSALEKLSDLNQKLKRSVKESLFGSEESETFAGPYQASRQTNTTPARYSNRDDIAPRRAVGYENRQAVLAQYQQDVELPPRPQYDHGAQTRLQGREEIYARPIPATNYQQPMHRGNQPQYSNPESYAPPQDDQRVQNYSRPALGEQYGARSGMVGPNGPMPQPMHAVMPVPVPVPVSQYAPTNQPRQNQEYRTGHYQNPGGVSQQQFDQQETATQKLLRLSAENQSLMEARQSVAAENKRLKAQLLEQRKLLKDIESGIAAARRELQNANQNNADLRKEIAALQSEKDSQLRASARQLNAIRKKLDDVLMLEMTSK